MGPAPGLATLRQTAHGVLVMARVTGLELGEHGFHIHTTASCKPDFAVVGGHFNPIDKIQGLNHAEGFHAGDLTNFIVATGGTRSADFSQTL